LQGGGWFLFEQGGGEQYRQLADYRNLKSPLGQKQHHARVCLSPSVFDRQCYWHVFFLQMQELFW